MKKSLVYALMIILALSLTAIGCQKVETESTPAPVAVEVAPATEAPAEETGTIAIEGELTTTVTDTTATDTTATDTMATDTTTPPSEK